MSRTKVIIAGPKSSGKTCLAHILTKKDFPRTYVPIVFQTEVVDVTDGANQHEIVLEVLDEVDLRSALPHQEVNVVLLCIGRDNARAIEIAELWISKLKTIFPNARIVLVGTKCDLQVRPTQFSLATTYDSTMAASQGTSAYVECSAKNQQGIPDLIKAVLEVTQVTPTFAKRIMDRCLIQ